VAHILQHRSVLKDKVDSQPHMTVLDLQQLKVFPVLLA
jgi:hypothetical protein